MKRLAPYWNLSLQDPQKAVRLYTGPDAWDHAKARLGLTICEIETAPENLLRRLREIGVSFGDWAAAQKAPGAPFADTHNVCVLPSGSDPLEYRWPVSNRGVIICDTGETEEVMSALATELLRCGATIIAIRWRHGTSTQLVVPMREAA